jgi:hypothetical protein
MSIAIQEPTWQAKNSMTRIIAKAEGKKVVKK